MSVRLVREESGPPRTIELVTTCQRIHATEAQS